MRIFLTKNVISDCAADANTYAQGFKLYENGAVTESSFIRQGSVYLLSAKINDEPKNARVYVVFSENGTLTSHHCTCDAAYVWRGACKHICAALCHLIHKDDAAAKRRAYERSAANILSGLEAVSLSSQSGFIIPSDEKVSLIPTFIYDTKGPYASYLGAYISFQVGVTHKYIIKNISEFLKAMADNTTVSYGKKLAFLHSPQNLDAASQALYAFLKTEAENALDYLKNFTNILERSMNIPREMPLSSAGLDRFFSLYEGTYVNSVLDGINRQLIFSADPAPIRYELTDNGDGSIKLTGENQFLAIRGWDYDYLLMGDALYKTSKARYAVIEAIEGELNLANGYSAIFYGKDTGKLLSFVTPLLKREGLADVAAIEEKHNVRELTKKIYLDASDTAAMVTANVLFCYDGYEINALDTTTPAPDIHRDDLAESALKNTLVQYGFTEGKNEKTPQGASERLYVLTDAAKIYNFYRYGVTHMNGMALVYATDAFKRKSQKAPMPKTTFGIRLKGDLLEIAPVGGSYSIRELLNIVDAWSAKKKFYPLKDGRFIDLTENDLTQEAQFLNALDINARDIKDDAAFLPASRAMYVDSLISAENAPFFDRDAAFNKIVTDFNDKTNHGFDIPESLENILRGYQKEGFYWLSMMARYRFGGILADDMGLGKTIQVISLLLYYKQTQADVLPSIVIAPTSLIYNWEREFRRFAPDINTLVISKAAQKQEIAATNADAIITTYDLLKRDADYFAAFSYSFVIADEAQNIKNPITQNAKAVKKLKAQARFALTGTPIENSLSELWSIFDFVMPGYLHSYRRFSKTYEQLITKNRDEAIAHALKKQIAPFILRRVKKDVLSEIPEKLQTNLYADMTDEQKRLYSAYHLKAKGELEDIFDKNMMKESRIKILSFITRLRQICCHPGVFIDKYKGGSGKLSIVMETVKNCIESGHRMLLFSQFTSMLDIIIAEFNENGMDYFYIDGATPAKTRTDMAERFNGGEKEVFLISLKAGGTGLNLTGADVVIHFDPWWNPAVMDQASDRAHRIGQKNVVQVFNVVAKDTIEEKIMALQDKKRDLIDLVIEGGANFINKLTPQELRELFA